MEWEHLLIKMVLNMREVGNWIKKMGKEHKYFLMVMFMMQYGSKENFMEKELFHLTVMVYFKLGM
jgi:hypothetical protein